MLCSQKSNVRDLINIKRQSRAFHRIIRLKKTTKITKSNHQLITPCPLTTSLSATSPRFLNTSRDSDSITSLGRLCHCSTTLSEKSCFLSSNLMEPPNGSNRWAEQRVLKLNSCKLFSGKLAEHRLLNTHGKIQVMSTRNDDAQIQKQECVQNVCLSQWHLQ